MESEPEMRTDYRAIPTDRPQRGSLDGRVMNEESLFAEALGKMGEARAAFLDEHCKGDVELRKRLEALLRAADNPDPFLEAPVPAPVATVDEVPVSERPGALIGPYKLLEAIGEGGMGTVWMAQQTEPV